MSGARPNILFLMTDQHRVDTLPAYGNSTVQTPAIDRIAGRGSVFERCYTPSAICTPARASLLTGLHPFEHGLLSNYEWNSGHREELPDGVPTFSAALRDEGYALGHVGKWHVGRHRGPDAYGFEGRHLPGALNPYDDEDYTAWLDEHGHPPFAAHDPVYTRAADGSRGHLIAARLAQPTEATFEAYLADRAIEMLRRFADDGRPFSLSLHYFGPHLPYLLPDEWYDRYDPSEVVLPASMSETFAGKPEVQRTYSAYWGADSFDDAQWRKLTAVYWGYVAMIDHQYGRVLDELDRLGLTDTTAVFATADHGEFTGAHRLNDKGPAMYEDIYRIPGIVSIPGGVPGRRAEFVNLLDFTATILDLAGAPTAGCRGRSLLPLLSGGGGGEPADGWRDELIAEFHGHHFSYAQRMLRTDRHKLVVNPEGIDEFYDLDADPHELHNAIDVPRHAATVSDLRLRLYRELVARGDRFAQWLAFRGGIPESERVRPETAVEARIG